MANISPALETLRDTENENDIFQRHHVIIVIPRHKGTDLAEILRMTELLE